MSARSSKRAVEIVEIPLLDVVIPRGRPMPGPKRINDLTDSIVAVGLLHPIGITEDKILIYGRGRIEAFRELGRPTIPALIHPLKGLKAELAEIDENLVRKKLSKMDEAKETRRRKQIYEAMFPETKRGVAGGKTGGRGRKKQSGEALIATEKISFAIDTAQKTGKTARAVRMDVALAEQLQAVPEDVQEKIAKTPLANNKTQLKALSSLDESTQREVVEVVKGGKAKTVADALGVLEGPEEDKPEIDLKAARADLENRVSRMVKGWVEETQDIDGAVKALRKVARDLLK